MRQNSDIAKKISKTHNLIKFFLTVSVFILTMFMATNSHAKFINKFKDGFYFEKYKTAEEAKTELLKRHPIGSDVEPLLETLRGAEAEVTLEKWSKFALQQYPNKREIYYGYSYYRSSWIPGVGGTWGGGIDFDENNKIIDFGVGIVGEGF